MNIGSIGIEEYIREEDPSEYYFALKYFNSFSSWEDYVLQHKEEVDSWRRALKAKIKSNALAHILEISKGETRDALSANKLLLDSPWEENPRGRPSKQDIAQETKRIVDNTTRLNEDYALYESWTK